MPDQAVLIRHDLHWDQCRNFDRHGIYRRSPVITRQNIKGSSFWSFIYCMYPSGLVQLMGVGINGDK